MFSKTHIDYEGTNNDTVVLNYRVLSPSVYTSARLPFMDMKRFNTKGRI